MASNVSIVNFALDRLGASPITDFGDGTPEANLATRHFAEIRDQLLREHVWNFALRRKSLAASAVAPLWGYARQFTIPADFLRLVEVQDGDVYDVKVESHATDGRVFVTDLPAPLMIAYIAQIEDANAMDPSFRRALSLRVALEWATKLTGTTAIVEQVAKEYDMAVREARTADGQEDTPSEFRVDTWIRARN